MPHRPRLIQFIHLLLYALVAGVFWGTWFSLSRSITALSAATFLEVGHTMIRNLGGPMSVLMPAAIVSNIVVSAMLYRARQMRAFAFATAALLLLVVALAITLTVNVPIDGQIRDWTVQTLPVDWERIRDRWELYHSLRTFASLLGMSCAFLSLLSSLPKQRA